jgi:hypothetical protein
MAKRLKDLTKIPSLETTSSLVVVSDNATNLILRDDLRTSLVIAATSNTLGGVKVGPTLTISQTGVLNAVNEIPTQTNHSGRFLTTDGNSVRWAQLDIPPDLPPQGGKSGKYLKTNGSIASWEFVPSAPDTLPTRANNNGKFLSTDGTILNWAAITGLPSQTGNASKILKTDGSNPAWSSAIQVDGNDQITLTAGANKTIIMQSPVVFPSYTEGDRNQLQAVAGMVVFNTSATKLQVYTGSSWDDLH